MRPQNSSLDNKDPIGSSPLPSPYCSSPLRGSPSSSCSSVGIAPDFSFPAAKSDQSAFGLVLHFINDLQFYIEDLKLTNIDIKTYWKLVTSLEDPRKVGGSIADSIRSVQLHKYTEVFTVKCMPTIVHDAILPYYSHEFGKMYKRDFITDAEKGSGIKKQADVSVYYGEGVFPSLVCEVGFTESYIDLLEDARQWLEKSYGKVRLVMIVKLEEEKKSTIKSGAINPLREEDNTRQVPEDDDSEGDNQAVEEFGSDPASYEDLRISCKTDD
ncbi:hypothetical protein Q9L58_008329 [Maublancomyces gigas]|uniref:Uncharacterized protein n=1 Tax=Discina gigas TaxID=1032678 RepID=A0ABR3G9Z5_9PEZI